MYLIAGHPLILRLPSGEVTLRPGDVIELSDETAKRLLVKAEGLIHVLGPPLWVEWESPAFGKCTGEVVVPPEQGALVVRHHLLAGALTVIPTKWLTNMQTRTQAATTNEQPTV